MILHVDMDAFYASVEERDQPELAGKPLIVGGAPAGRGVVAAANYAVRKFGVHSAMPTATALRLCPQAIVLPPRMDHYADISSQIRRIFERFTPLVEPLSLDEAFLDVTGVTGLFGEAATIARNIKDEIRQHLHLVASVGVAPNKFVAKIASDLHKPDALVVVAADEIQGFLDPLPVTRLWGVGRVTGEALERLGIRTIGDVRRLTEAELQRQFGRIGTQLLQLAHGIDDRPVVPDREAKSISHETTFAADLNDIDVLRAWLLNLTEQVACRLRRRGQQARTVQIKVRLSDFRTITRSHTLAASTCNTQPIWQAASNLLTEARTGRQPGVRLLGVGVSGFDATPQKQLSLFPNAEQARDARLDHVRDSIQERFGAGALLPASGLLHRAQHTPQPRPGS